MIPTRGARPNIEVNPIRNAIETLGYLTGSILPKKISGDERLVQKIILTPQKETLNPNVNIILIMGESLNRNMMSLYGYEKITTPFLDSLKKSKNFFYKKGISAGVYTDVSIPSFFNLIYRPNGLPQILSTNTCLFKMAKENGFITHFRSAQSKDGLSNIKSYLCMRWIDNYSDGSLESGKLKENALDGILIEKIKKVDFRQSNFVVLHQIGSHSPYKKRYPASFGHFQGDDKKHEYENSVLYTDYVLQKIIEYVKQHSQKPTYIIFTADHGESVGNNGRYGHGHIEFKEQHEVPFFIYVLKNVKNIKTVLPESNFISHFDMGKVIANLLGYSTTELHSNKTCYICGSDISGIAGFLEVNLSKESPQITSVK